MNMKKVIPPLRSDTKATRQIKYESSIGLSGERGGSFITFCSIGSTERERARVTAETILTQRIWTGVIGRVNPKRIAAMITVASAPLAGKRNRIVLRRLS